MLECSRLVLQKMKMRTVLMNPHPEVLCKISFYVSIVVIKKFYLRQGIPQVVEPIPPPRSRRSSDQSVMVDIPAATAVAGGIAANQELPYMTPPITQTNFSGDSQDSSSKFCDKKKLISNIIFLI